MYSFLKGKFAKEGLSSLLARLHRDERGAEGLEKLLIIAAFVLPLLGLLMWYKDDIAKWINGIWSQRKEEGSSGDYSQTGDPTH
jgi:Flp pilus assembly pilin Flp